MGAEINFSFLKDRESRFAPVTLGFKLFPDGSRNGHRREYMASQPEYMAEENAANGQVVDAPNKITYSLILIYITAIIKKIK